MMLQRLGAALRRRRLLGALLAAALLMGAAVASTSAASASGTRPAKPTVVLVHGAFAGARTVEVNASHVAMMSKPAATAELIVEAATTTAR